MRFSHGLIVQFLCAAVVCFAASAPDARLKSAIVAQPNPSPYFWRTTAINDTADIVTLVCRSCETLSADSGDIPLVSVMRDTSGTANPQDDRISYVWLLSYEPPGLRQKVLSAVPFFYWRVRRGSDPARVKDPKPIFNLSTPQHPMLASFRRDLLQWTALDPLDTPVRAVTRAYRSNELDHERFHLEETLNYLRQAPVETDKSALTSSQLNSVIARLELRKKALGGMVEDNKLAKFGEESRSEQYRVRSRNWELLRQSAERTGLYFESLNLAGTQDEYGMLWFPVDQSVPVSGTSLRSTWKLLNISDPSDKKASASWRNLTFDRALDEEGRLLPAGAQGTPVELRPLGVYSLSYPRLPLLLVDFRDKRHLRHHEILQRTINEVTAGVIGISHFTNWYYYVASDVYSFVVSRRGGATNQQDRLDSYSQFSANLALDHQLDPRLQEQIREHLETLAVNPLEGSAARELQAAKLRLARLEAQAGDGGALTGKLVDNRRAELAAFEESRKAELLRSVLHNFTFGLYTHRAPDSADTLAQLESYRTVETQLNFLDRLVSAGTAPEVAYQPGIIQNSILQLQNAIASISAADIRAHASATLTGLQRISDNHDIRASCAAALIPLGTLDRDVQGTARVETGPTGAVPERPSLAVDVALR